MPGGGAIRIATANSLNSVVLSVADTGCGIQPANLAHVFEPFFTTKERGKGTGLGLSTVADIVRQNGGDIRVQSEPGQGAIFAIRLPGVRQAAPSERGPHLVPPQTGNETLLLVEDEDSVRKLLAHMLQNRGYHVLEAANAAEALPLFEKHAAGIDLVLTDIVMPGMSGLDMIDRLREIRPDTRVVIMSGYSGDDLARIRPLPEGTSFLPKPLHPEVLASRVREALNSPSRPFNPR
jgi:two-component system cell cycle sensor histidine kinase/response regulator CckA